LRLSELIGGNGDAAAIDVRGLAADSREVRPGFLFAALSGSRNDGAAFIAEAIGRGAVAVLARPGTPVADRTVRVIEDDNPRRRLARLAARFYPDQPATAVAVTGTNGKTSVVTFTRQLWAGLGACAASFGTLGIEARDFTLPLGHTTPDPVTLHRLLADLAHRGIDHLAIEASSHGLDQHRLDGMRLVAAGFTNLSRDHLDYHADAAAYGAAKRRLFVDVMRQGVAVLNADDPEGEALVAVSRRHGHRVLSYGRNGRDLRLVAQTPDARGQRLTLDLLGERHLIALPLAGSFQASNALCALGLALASGSPLDPLIEGLATLRGARGRLQLVGWSGADAPVYVDYAHTPDALAQVLATLRPHVGGTLAVVFGCGGDRDRGKRPEMGRVAAAAADRVIVTDDNPRSEEPAAIRRAILAGCPGAREIGDRALAIGEAVAALGAGDGLLIAGKGHEQGQIVGLEVRPFDDAAIALAALTTRGGRSA